MLSSLSLFEIVAMSLQGALIPWESKGIKVLEITMRMPDLYEEICLIKYLVLLQRNNL